jgi:hypothetical protein
MSSPTFSPGRALAALTVFAVTLGALAFASAPALALQAHVFSSSFGEPCSGQPCGKGQFEGPTGVAVNEVTVGDVGDVYVVDHYRSDKRVEVFNAAGAYLSEFAVPDASSESEPVAIATDNSVNPLDPSAGDVYVTDVSNAVVDKFTAGGVFIGHITTGADGVPFHAVVGLAVDPNGVVWVDQQRTQEEDAVDSYSDALTNEFLNSSTQRFASGQIAVDSEDNLYIDLGRVMKRNSSGQVLIPEVDSSERRTEGIAVDPSTNDVYLDEIDTADGVRSIAAFSPAGALIERFGSDLTSGEGSLAIDSSSGTVYATERSTDAVKVFTSVTVPDAVSGEATNLQQTGGLATLNGTVNPGGAPVTSCEFEYGETESYGQIAPCIEEPGEIGSGESAVAVRADVKELVPLTTYHFRLVASSSTGTRDAFDRTFFIPTPPTVTVSGESASSVGSTTAIIGAQINPGGLPATYHVEYGTTSAYGSSTPELSVGAGLHAVGVQVELSGLQSGSVVYHFKVIATNALGPISSGDLTFTTLAAPGSSALALPDNRAYELVSPTDNADGDVEAPNMGAEDLPGFNSEASYNTSFFPFQASPAGNAVVYQADPTPAGGNGQVGNGIGNEFLATHNPAGGWTALDIQPPYNRPRFQVFSEDLSVGIVGATGNPQLGFPGAEGIELFSLTVSNGSYQPVYPLHQKVESAGYENGALPEGLDVEGLSADGSHLLFEADAKLTMDSPEPGQANNLYDSVGGRLSLVNVPPNGTPEPNAIFGGIPPGHEEVPDYSHDISADGSRVFWTDLNTHKLYVRENDTQPQSPLGEKGECTVSTDACTVEVDASHNASVASGGGQFWTAARDGSKVFFTACTRLTENSTAVSGAEGCAHGGGGYSHRQAIGFESNPPTYTGNDLYEYDVSQGTLTDLTVDQNPGDALGADVQSMVATSEDGSYVYFEANGALAPGAESRTCTVEEESEGKIPAGRGCNLYVSHNGGAPVFVTVVGSAGEVRLDNSEVTPDGQHLVLESGRRLTGYNNLSIKTHEPVPEVFLYDTATNHLSCVSCNPSGEPPVHGADLGGQDSANQDGLGVSYSNYLYHPHWMSNDGSRVFFNSGDAVVPQDSDGSVDVYEWERDGAGSCQQGAGCLYLLSGGVSASPSYFVDASASGEDVFFVTRAQLVPQDRNFNTDLYDARVNGGVSQLTASACTGTGCQGVPPAPPIFATPSSVTFNGIGNFPPPSATKPRSKPSQCKRGFVKKHNKCVKAKAKKKTRGRRVSNHRRAGR